MLPQPCARILRDALRPKARLVGAYLHGYTRLLGRPFPRPTHPDLRDGERLARWLAARPGEGRRVFLAELAGDGLLERYMAGVWDLAGTVRVRREPSLAAATGKVLPFHVARDAHGRRIGSTPRPSTDV